MNKALVATSPVTSITLPQATSLIPKFEEHPKLTNLDTRHTSTTEENPQTKEEESGPFLVRTKEFIEQSLVGEPSLKENISSENTKV